VLDRLMKYFHWQDEQGLEQALLVAASRPIDLARIRAVSLAEGRPRELQVFLDRLRTLKRKRTARKMGHGACKCRRTHPVLRGRPDCTLLANPNHGNR
jgi:hypothetical protein